MHLANTDNVVLVAELNTAAGRIEDGFMVARRRRTLEQKEGRVQHIPVMHACDHAGTVLPPYLWTAPKLFYPAQVTKAFVSYIFGGVAH